MIQFLISPTPMTIKHQITSSTGFVFILLSLFLLLSCQPKAPTVDELEPDQIKNYIYAYSKGTINRTDPIRVEFAQTVATPEQVGQSLERNILSFKPSIDGRFYWENQRTLRFDPDDALPSGTEYRATVHLGALFDKVSKELQKFDVVLRTPDLSFTASSPTLKITDLSAPKEQQLSGIIYTSDFAEKEKVEQMIQVKYMGNSIPVSWTHSNNFTRHLYTTKGIKRQNESQKLEILVNGKPISSPDKKELSLTVPSVNEFVLMDALVHEGQDQHIQVLFSDPLEKKQNLKGLLRLSNYSGTIRTVIENNEIRIYPSQRLSGDHRLQVSPGIKNTLGGKLEKANTWDLSFQSLKPEVRYVGSGVILPNSDGLLLPFEAIGLRAVDVEIFKIFNNNILQFLQSNTLDGQSSLATVGRVVQQRQVELKSLNRAADQNFWARYAVDLAPLIKEDPGAIYQVRLGFRPGYSIYGCEGEASGDALLPPLEGPDAQGNFKSITEVGYYGPDGYYSGFRWEDRDDPCKSAYFNSDRISKRNILASNLGIIIKGTSSRELLVAVTDLRTAKPVGGATLEFYDYQQQKLGESTSDAEGMAAAQFTRPAAFAVAKWGG